MICQNCGVEAATQYVSFHQNIGVLVMRFSKSASGNMCKSCIHSTFWQFTLITLTLGWWGILSFILTPFFLLNNVCRYIFCLGLDPVPPGATQPELTEEILERLYPHTEQLIERLDSGDDFQRVVENVAMRARVSNGQVALYVHALVEASQ